MESIADLPIQVQKSLDAFCNTVREAFESDLDSIILYGSAAEGRLRTTSDVNLILVLKRFNQGRVDKIREQYRLNHAATRLTVMFLLKSEVELAIESFAVKFSDILSRHRVLFGSDPFANLSVSREATKRRLKQVLINLILRLRERYVLLSLREEQLIITIAEAAGPIRSCAASILELEGKPTVSPKEALQLIVDSFQEPNWNEVLNNMSQAREERMLKPGKAGPTLLHLIELTERLRGRVEKLT